MSSITLISLYQFEGFGVRSIYSYLKAQGVSANMIFFKDWDWREDLSYSDEERRLLIDELKRQSPEVVGIGFRSLFMRHAVDLTAVIKEALPDSRVIWGGCHPTIDPEACIKHCDGLVIGEGEKPCANLVQQWGEPAYWQTPGTWLKKGDEVLRNDVGELNNLEELPFPDFEDEFKCSIARGELSRGDPLGPLIANGTYNFMGSRGCPFSCSYCGHKVIAEQHGVTLSRFMRSRTVDSVIQELKQVKKRFNVKRFSSRDDVFVLDKKWFSEFVDRYEREIGCPFHCQVHPTQINEEIIEQFKRLGLQTISFGVQSGSEDTRKNIYNRNTPDEMLIEKAKLLHDAHIFTCYDFIFENPLENRKEERCTLDLLLRFPRPFNINMYKLQLLPGTELTKKVLIARLADPSDVQGSLESEAGKFDLNSYDTGVEQPESLYWKNLVYLLCTVMRVNYRSGWFAITPVPQFVISFLAGRRWFFLNRFTWVIRKQRVLYSWLGVKISGLLPQ